MLTFVQDKDVYNEGYDIDATDGAINTAISLYIKGKLKKKMLWKK